MGYSPLAHIIKILLHHVAFRFTIIGKNKLMVCVYVCVCVLMKIEPRVAQMLGKGSWLYSQSLFNFLKRFIYLLFVHECSICMYACTQKKASDFTVDSC